MARTLVLGLGASGLAMVRWLAGRGFTVRVADTRMAPPQLENLRRELDVEFFGGDFAPALLDDVELVALSPGLSPTHSPAARLVREAKSRKIEVLGEIELFARALVQLRSERGYAPRVIGITGTNGKTTTTRLTGLLIERCGLQVAVAGNIDPPALDELRVRLAADTLPAVWVLELSSFQLATTRSLACDAATVLNLSQDHLDWHGTMEQYVAAKARIFTAGTAQILNRDDERVMAMARRSSRVVSFGAGLPGSADSFGLLVDHGVTWLAWCEDTTPPGRRRRTVDARPAPEPELFLQRLMPVEALRIRGRHNAMNALAALALARAVGCPMAPCLHALREYAGEPHRVALVASIGGVEYYDDSKGTNVGATVAALDGLGGEGRKLVVILGGEGKGQDFAPLASAVARHARAAVLIGRDAGLIRTALMETSTAVIAADSLEQAVQISAEQARAGDAVLLSPACASLDMFRDYKHRAAVYVDAVRELAAEAGQPC
jgi:UDP-N-acetylmuramoylalanine--D-glutamate ligase